MNQQQRSKMRRLKRARNSQLSISPLTIVIGLGNTGAHYRATRHNVGFSVVDKIAKQERVQFKPGPSSLYTYAECALRQRGGRLVLIKPQTYINNSGQIVAPLRRHYPDSRNTQSWLVVCDTLDLPVGRLRIKKQGSSAGHGGLRSIIALVGSDFPRLSIGIGRPNSRSEVQTYVLSRPPREEQALYTATVQIAADAIRAYAHNLDKMIEVIHGAPR